MSRTPGQSSESSPTSPASTEAPCPAPRGRGDGVMAHYLQTMQGFLQAERRVLEEYLHGAPPRPRGGRRIPIAPTPGVPTRPSGPDDQTGPLPLLGEVLAMEPGLSLVARRRIDPDEDLYLHDHTFGGAMSLTDPTLEPLLVAPLTISLELMAEAAALLLPNLLLTSMDDVRAHRWVQVDESAPTVLEIAARRLDESPQVRVEVREIDAAGTVGAMVIEGTMLFGAAYPEPPAPEPLALANPLPPYRTARQMYDEKWMFHGPLFQGVASLDSSGANGIAGTLEVLPTAGLFRSTQRPRLLTDLALLDAAGQLLGYWAKERLPSSFLVFPVRVASLHIYGPNLPVGTRVRCHVRVTELLPQTVKVDMDVLDPHGRLWMRVCGWQDWRFHIEGAVYDFWRFPAATITSAPLALPRPPELPAEAMASCRLATLAEVGHAMMTKSLAYMALNHAERQGYHDLRGPAPRQVEWLAGRIAAKDAVRLYLRQRHGLEVAAADVEIAADEHGRPEARGAWQQQIGAAPLISLAHTDGIGVALAVDATGLAGVGIDLQDVSPQTADFDRIAFTADELALLYAVEGAARDERRTRFWCAKEAAAKAVGRGLIEGPRSVAVEAWDETTGTAHVGLRGLLATTFPHLARRRLAAYTLRDGDHIIATSFVAATP